MLKSFLAMSAAGLIAVCACAPATAGEENSGISRKIVIFQNDGGTVLLKPVAAVPYLQVAEKPIKGDPPREIVWYANPGGGEGVRASIETGLVSAEKSWTSANKDTGVITAEGWHASPGPGTGGINPGGGTGTAPPN